MSATSRVILLTALVSSQPLLTYPADIDGVLADYTFASWGNALPNTNIPSIAQDSQGYLWLATDDGLIRFDGVRFVMWQPSGPTLLPAGPVQGVYVSRDDSLWVGFRSGGKVSRIRNGDVRNYDGQDGLARGAVTAFVEDHNGTIWAGHSAGLYHLNGDRWTKVEPAHGLPKAQVHSVYVDRRGNLLVGTGVGLFQRAKGADRFQYAGHPDDFGHEIRGISEDPAGGIFVTDDTAGFRRLDAPKSSIGLAKGSGILHDRRGNLWVGGGGQGLWRVRYGSGTQRPTIERAGAFGARSLFEDREGNIWAASGPDGLHRLTERRVTSVTDVGPVTAMEVTPDGSVWVGAGDELTRFSADRGWQGERQRLPGTGIRALHTDQQGTLWVATGSSLVRLENGRPSQVPLPRDHQLRQIQSVTSDSLGHVWIFDLDQGLFRLKRTGLERFGPVPALERTIVTSIYMDSQARLWISSAAGRLCVIGADGDVQTYGPEDGLASGPYRSIYEGRDGAVWIAGGDGLSRFANDRFATVTHASGLPIGVAGIVEDDEGHLWMGTRAGLVRLRRGEFDKAVASRSYRLQYSLFDQSDGVSGMLVWRGGRGAVRAGDGRLWFATTRGLANVNPRRLENVGRPVNVTIEEVTADQRVSNANVTSSLPPATRTLQINYTALNLTTPQKILFRYRLEGFDTNWINAGTRREAVYTNLPPRTYSFRVLASSGDGVWSDAGAVWSFSIPPRFYQAGWFFAACGVTLVVVTCVSWRLRLRQVRRQFSLILLERVRLSREIHDTLLQGLVGIALQFEAVSDSLDQQSAARTQLMRIRQQVDEYIRDARDSIWNLRSAALEVHDLGAELRAFGERITAGTLAQFEFTLSGTRSQCSPEVNKQLLRIGQEALVNAIRHGEASRVQMDLRYDDDAVVLRVADNGCGFDPAHSASDVGHYGLVGLKERAEQVRGRLTLVTAPGSGTVLETVVPID